MPLEFGNKIEDNGKTSLGRLTATEFNTLVSFLNNLESTINDIAGKYIVGVNVDGMTVALNENRESIVVLPKSVVNNEVNEGVLEAVSSDAVYRAIKSAVDEVRSSIDDTVSDAIENELNGIKGALTDLSKIKIIKVNGDAVRVADDGSVDIYVPTVSQDDIASVVNDLIEPYKTPKFNIETETSDQGVTLKFVSESGSEIASTSFAGGGGTSQSANISLPLTASAKVVKSGSPCKVSYAYNHLNGDGSETGVSATLTISIQQGLKSPTTQIVKLQPSLKTYEIDLTEFAKEPGLITVRISAVADDGLKKQVVQTIDVRELSLRLQSTDCITKATSGGHVGEVVVPYYVTGAGSKVVTMLVNGKDRIVSKTIFASGTTLDYLTIPQSALIEGGNTVQMIAESDGVQSECIYFDVLYNPLQKPLAFIGLYVVNTGGELVSGTDHFVPKIKAVQYENVSVQFVSYCVNALALNPDGNTFIPSKLLQTYSKRYKKNTDYNLSIAGDGVSKMFVISVSESNVNLNTSSVGLVVELDADGKSNSEKGRDVWESNGFNTSFIGVDFSSSGWENGALCLRSGASATINYMPFAKEPTEKGWTMEVEVKTDTVLDDEIPVISCLSGDKGFAIYPSKAALYTGRTTLVTTENGEMLVKGGVEMSLSTEEYVRIAFVLHQKENYRLMELFSNGVRISSDVYEANGSFVQDVPQPIILSSSDSNVSVRSIRIYDRVLSDDELVNNYITSRTSASEMDALYINNDVLNNAGQYEAPRTIKRGRLFVKRTGGLVKVFQSVNKKEDFLCEEVRYESPFGEKYDFVAKNVFIRIQGTSSTKYPWKNIRIYLNKGDRPQLWIGGVLVTGTSGDAKADAKKNVYAMSETAKAVSVFTCKCDYSDSSMTHNTGFARLYHNLCSQLGLQTPPQETDPTVRASIEGYPCDIYNEDINGGGVEFYGQYNFNNDKSKSDAVFGMKGIDVEAGACSLEFLNNSHPLCLFKTENDTDAAFDDFDSALEFNIPEDTLWSTSSADQISATTGQRNAVKRLWNFIGRAARSCGANVFDPEEAYNDVNRFKNSTFKSEAKNYFDVNRMLMWYLFTDYLALVDQRAKNMIIRTWDGLKWFFTYYDGDTALGGRNDSFLAYLYDVERNTYDFASNKYAFEGHSSWLWCLVLANFEDELRAMAETLRAKMKNEVVLDMLNTQQMGAWSARAYNKSGALKYIVPATSGVMVAQSDGSVSNVVSDYMHALQGNREAHRTHFVKKRFAFLDAKYLTELFRTDNIAAYISRDVTHAPSIVGITASQKYRYGYGRQNGALLGKTEFVAKGQVVDLQIVGGFTKNDPIRIYGASGIRVLDLTKINQAGSAYFPLQNNFVLTLCTSLREIRAGQSVQSDATGGGQTPFVLFDVPKSLEYLDVRNIYGISVGSSGAFDLSTQQRLKYLDARNTGATNIMLSEGALVSEAYLPDTLIDLTLRNLPNISDSSLHFDGWENIKRFNFTNCPKLNWKAMLSKCVNLTHLRVEGVLLSGDGTELDDWAKYGGLTANGSTTQQARITGVYKLTRYRDDIAELRVALPELSIEQAPYTGIEWDDSTNNEDNITNLDNGTGFRGTDGYIVSGHIKELLHRRDRVLTKYDADTQTLLFTRLLKDNANYYADGQPAKLDGTQGDIMVYEPERWTKGVNDHYGLKKYGYWSLDAPAPPNSRKVLPIEMTTLKNIKLLYGETLSEASSTNTYYTTYIAPIDGAVGVRWPSAFGIEVFAYFLDAQGTIVARHASIGQINGMEHGLYLFKARPEGAVKIAFCLPSTITPEYVLLTESLDPFEFEPDWVYEPAYMLGATLCIEGLNGLRCVAHGTGSFANYNMDQAMSMARGLGAGYGLMDYDRWRSVVLLWMATVGSRIATGGNLNASSLSASFAHPLDRIFFSKADNANQTYYSEGGVEAVVNAYHLLGYDCWIGVNPVWLDGVIQRYGYNLNGNRSSYNLSGRETIQVSTTPWKITNAQTATKYILHGRYMDVLSVMTGSPSKSNYWSGRGQDANNVNFKYFFVNRYWNVNNITGMDVGSSTSLSAIRLQYTGKMRELSNQDYRALWT